jgi:hypothetical protein
LHSTLTLSFKTFFNTRSLKDGENCSISAEAAEIVQKEEEIFPTGKSKVN